MNNCPHNQVLLSQAEVNVMTTYLENGVRLVDYDSAECIEVKDKHFYCEACEQRIEVSQWESVS